MSVKKGIFIYRKKFQILPHLSSLHDKNQENAEEYDVINPELKRSSRLSA